MISAPTAAPTTALIRGRRGEVGAWRPVGGTPRATGKGRKERSAILTTERVAVLREWLREREGHPHEPLFPTRRGGPLTPRASRCCSTSTRPPQAACARRSTP